MSTQAITAASVSPAPDRSRLYWAIADTLMIARRHVLHIPQVPEQLFAATLSPIMFVLLFRFVFGGAIAVPGESYINFMMAGAFVQAVVGEGMVSGVGLATDLKNGIIDRFRTLPMSPLAVVAGPTVADLIRNLLGIVVMVVVGLAVGFRPEAGLTGWVAVLALLLATSFTVSWIGSVIALVVRDPQAVQTVGFTTLVPLSFVSSAFVPVETMPGWLQPFVQHQPITVIIDAVRALLLGQPAGSSVWQAFAWCGGIVAVCMTISVLLYQRMARLATGKSAVRGTTNARAQAPGHSFAYMSGLPAPAAASEERSNDEDDQHHDQNQPQDTFQDERPTTEQQQQEQNDDY